MPQYARPSLIMKQGSVLITGAAGFLGSHLCEKLLSEGHQVIGIDNFITGGRQNVDFLKSLPEANDNFNFIEHDVSTPWPEIKLNKALTHCFHFASPASPPLYQKNPFETIWANTTGLYNALTFSHQHNARLIFASTSEIYGNPSISPQPESYWGNTNSYGPRSCYDEAKRLGESIIWSFNQQYGTKHGLVRIFNTYGPRMNPDDGRVIINFLVQFLRKTPLTVYGNGHQTRSFCYIDDLIEGVLSYAFTEICEPVNIGNDFEMKIIDVVETLKDMFPADTIEVVHSDLPQDDPLQRRPDLQKAERLLGWRPKVSLREGLEKMIAWLRDDIGIT